MEDKNKELLHSFVEYCIKHKQERFWQSLRNWSGANKILFEEYNKHVDDMLSFDTFYWEEKNPHKKAKKKPIKE